MKGKSTEDTVVALTEYLYENLNSKRHSIAVFIDFAKAFDTVDHCIMLNKLEAYGIRGLALDLFRSFLSNRNHTVKMNNSISAPKSLNIGLPQGSQLAPLLFLLYINDLANISDNFYPLLYADDTTLCFSGLSQYALFNLVNSELSKFYLWTLANRLTINIGKTNYMLISNRAPNGPEYDLSINQRRLECQENVRFLGVIIDHRLKFNAHISYISDKLSKSVGVLNSMKTFVPYPVLKSLYYSFLYPYIYYCIAIWGGTYSVHLHPLRITQKRAVRAICNEPYRAPSNPIFIRTEILKLDDVYKFKICDFLLRNDLFDSYHRTHSHSTRHRSNLLPMYQRLTSCQKSINFAGPLIWNLLPESVKNSESRPVFKRNFKINMLNSYANS